MMKKTRRTQTLKFRLTEGEYAAFKAFCAQSGVSPSEAMRRFAREAAGFGPSLEGEDREMIRALTGEMRALQSHVLDVVRGMNNGNIPASETLRQAFSAIRSALVEDALLYGALCAKARERAVKAIVPVGSRASAGGRALAAITPEERERRRVAVENAEHENRLEGIAPDPEAKPFFDAYVNGEIDFAGLKRLILEHDREMPPVAIA